MAELNLECLWNVVQEYKFDYASTENFSCVICMQLMIDAYQSHCGCYFCYKCIHDYLGIDNRFCPGQNQYCHDEYLILENNVFRDAALNRKILSLKVICPNQSCGSKIILSEIDNHLKLCLKPLPLICPYASIGCSIDISKKDSVISHLSGDSMSDAQLLMESMQNMRNEIGVLKESFVKITSENATLRDELKNDIEGKVRDATEQVILGYQRTMDDQGRQIENLRSNVNELKNEMSEMAKNNNTVEIRQTIGATEIKGNDFSESFNEIDDNKINFKHLKSMKDELNKMIEDQIDCERNRDTTIKDLVKHYSKIENISFEAKLKNDIDIKVNVEMKRIMFKQSQEIERLTTMVVDLRRDMMSESNSIKLEMMSIIKELREKENTIMEIERDISQVREEVRTDSKEINSYLEEQKEEIEDLRLSTGTHLRNCDTRSLNIVTICPTITFDFVWKIDHCSTKINRWIFSDSFYSNKYRLCLCVRIHCDNIGLWSIIVTGVNDDIVQWPMRLSVTMSILNQYTLAEYSSRTYTYNIYDINKCAFDRPTSDMNEWWIGENSSIATSYNKAKELIVVDDCIIVSCALSRPT